MNACRSSLNRPALCLAVVVVIFSSGLIGCRKKPTAAAPSNPADVAVVAFNSFGPSDSFSANCWGIGSHAHAEWFIPKISGPLESLEVAIEPGSGSAEVFIAPDANKFPGKPLEKFTVELESQTVSKAFAPFILKSTARPALKAGEKYWVGARSASARSWTWHFNDQKIIQSTARETEPGKWASAGDMCYVGAYRVSVVSTNR
jgi:hypothetical protein